ncbi:MAG TPA: two-component regulator propeller domain-containing protein [Candidatus Krumholzibacteria bacterium]|nr:two-component regulator propeller domain-containing protein [Candidatus Krumholzibacteria bacterium]
MRCSRFLPPVTLAALGALAALGVLEAPVRADVPFGWRVETFAGRIVEFAPGGGVLAGATDGGLLLFDLQTREFQQIADAGCKEGRCLRSNLLTSVARDDRGRYWVGTRGAGLSLLRPETGGFGYEHFFGANFRPGGGLLSDSVTAIAPWGEDVVYVGTRAGVAQIDVAGEVGEYNEESSRRRGVDLPDGDILDLAVDSLYVWVAQSNGIVRYRRLPPHDLEVLADSLAGTRVQTVVRQHGQIWAGTNRGVQLWDEAGRYWKRLRNVAGSPQPTPDFESYALVVRQPDPLHPLVVVASNLDVWTYNGFAWSRCNPPPFFLLEARRFEALTATGDTLWTCQINDNGEGAFLESWNTAQGCSWAHLEPSSIPFGPIHGIGVDRGNRDLWVGTQISGVARRTLAGVWCTYNGNDSSVLANMTNPSGNVSAFLRDRSGTTWFTHLVQEGQAPLDALRGDPGCNHAADQWDHIAPGEGGFGGRYWKIAEDGAGNRFFLSDGHPVTPGGLDVLKADGSDTLNLRSNLLGGSAVGAIAFDRDDSIWQFAYVGVNNLGNDGLREWINSDDLFNPNVNNFSTLELRFQNSDYSVAEYHDIVYDSFNRDLWVGTVAGLFRFDLASRSMESVIGAKSFTADGLLSLNVSDLLLDPNGNLWIGTDKGLNRIDTRESALVIDAFTTRETIDALNQEGQGAILYLPEQSLAPLPDPHVTALAFDPAAQLLHIGTEAGVATLDVAALDVRPLLPIEQAVVYPNPVRAASTEGAVYLGDVTLPATVTIYNLEGEVVSEKLITTPGVPAWDLRIVVSSSTSGVQFFEATSGVYLVRVSNDAGTKVTPLAVIR